MNEREIVEILERVMQARRFDGLYTSIEIILEAIQDLLDLYNKEKEKNKEYKDMIIRHKKQLKQSGIYGYDYDLKISEEE